MSMAKPIAEVKRPEDVCDHGKTAARRRETAPTTSARDLDWPSI
jgi:hypothetical protein